MPQSENFTVDKDDSEASLRPSSNDRSERSPQAVAPDTASVRQIYHERPRLVENGSPVSRAILAAALILGILGDLLLRSTPWGLNLFLWAFALIAAIFVLAGYSRSSWQTYFGLAGALVFAGGFAWRDSGVLLSLDLLALSAFWALGCLRRDCYAVYVATPIQYALAWLKAGLDSAAGMIPLLLSEVNWKPWRGGSRAATGLALGRGLVLAVPLLLVFGWLFSSADAAFKRLVDSAFDVSLPQLLSHIMIVVATAWCSGGYLRGLSLKAALPSSGVQRPRLLQLGMLDIAVPLGLLDSLFLVFVVVQFRYFFGGGARVQSVAGLTYSEYARSGFFELVAVACLTLTVLLGADWLLKRKASRDEIVIRSMSAVLIVLVFVIMVSAVQRMFLYVREYGQTELRVYTTAFMGWLAVLFCWFVVTVLRGRRSRFAFGAVASGLAIILLLHAINPDALIVRTNASRAAHGRSFDAAYNTSLSADSVPELVRDIGWLRPEDQSRVAFSLLEHWSRPKGDGITWNQDRSDAVRAVQDSKALLERYSSTVSDGIPIQLK